jgi:hypothetical protein
MAPQPLTRQPMPMARRSLQAPVMILSSLILSVFKAIIAGTVPGFNNPGTDTFAGTNVMSIVVEVPKTMLGTAATINVWAETKSK